METYKNVIKKLFEAIDPEGQLQQVQKEMEDSIESAVQAQVADKEAQVKALESELEQLKAQQVEEAPVAEEPAQEEPVAQEAQATEQQQKVAQLVQELEAQAEEACQKIEQQEQKIAELEKELADKADKLQTLQQSVVQNLDAQIQAAKLQQSEEDAQVAIEKTQELIQAVEQQHKEAEEKLAESISDFIDAFIDDKTQLNVAINATALAEAQSETFEKIRDLLIEKSLFESKVNEKAEAMILEAKETVNEQLNEAIAVNKKNIELQNEISILRGEKLLAEKVKFLKPSIAEALTEAFQGKTAEAIEKEFEKVQQQLEKNEEERKQLLRQQAKLRQQKIDRELKDAEDITEPVKQTKQEEKQTVQNAFAKLIQVRKI